MNKFEFFMLRHWNRCCIAASVCFAISAIAQAIVLGVAVLAK